LLTAPEFHRDLVAWVLFIEGSVQVHPLFDRVPVDLHDPIIFQDPNISRGSIHSFYNERPRG
jgi:hypothetical protein